MILSGRQCGIVTRMLDHDLGDQSSNSHSAMKHTESVSLCQKHPTGLLGGCNEESKAM